ANVNNTSDPVPGDAPDGNARRVQPRIHTAGPLPDLTIGRATLAAAGGGSALAVQIEVANLGGGDYGGGSVVRLDSSGAATSAPFSAIPPGGTAPIRTTMPVAASARVAEADVTQSDHSAQTVREPA